MPTIALRSQAHVEDEPPDQEQCGNDCVREQDRGGSCAAATNVQGRIGVPRSRLS